jgi:RHS repeat-associated protein
VGYAYLGGQLLAQYRDSTTYFVHHDHLGSTRLLTKVDQTIKDSMDFQPYGEQIAGDTGTTHKFTGKERDAETGLDYFGARYYSNGLGRWISADWSAKPVPVPYTDFQDPQTLNLYTYVRNLPTTNADSDGHTWEELKQDLKRAVSNTIHANKHGAEVVVNSFKGDAKLIAYGYSLAVKGLAENRNFSLTHISGKDLNNIGKNMTLILAGHLIGPEASVGSRAATAAPTMIGFSEAQTGMINQSIQNLAKAGYDVGPIKEVVMAEMGNKLGMSLSTGQTGMALSEGAFESQKVLDSTMEEELRHLNQDLSKQEFGPSTADEKEAEVDANRKFPHPQ